MRLLFIGFFIFLFSCKKDASVAYDINGNYKGQFSGSYLVLDSASGEYTWNSWIREDSITIADYNFEDSTFVFKHNDDLFNLKFNPVSKEIGYKYYNIRNGIIRNDTIQYSEYVSHTSSSRFVGVKQY